MSERISEAYVVSYDIYVLLLQSAGDSSDSPLDEKKFLGKP